MRYWLITLFSLVIISASSQKVSFYDFKVTSIDGSEYDFKQLKGKKILIVNTASKCGNTPQYKDLQELYTRYGGDNFEIIGFPANNFLNQEPGSNDEIKKFCEVNYGVTFPMMSKISVKGDDKHPLYKWLTTKALNGKMDSEVTWNFQKYMINENGELIGFLKPKEKPLSDELIEWIENK